MSKVTVVTDTSFDACKQKYNDIDKSVSKCDCWLCFEMLRQAVHSHIAKFLTKSELRFYCYTNILPLLYNKKEEVYLVILSFLSGLV